RLILILKKMKNILSLFLVMILVVSCTNDSITDNYQDDGLRTQFLEGKSSIEVKDGFILLSAEDKYKLWDEKLNQLLHQNLPSEHYNLIYDLKEELKTNYSKENNKIKEI